MYAHEHGCPWEKYTCYDAADNGHLECLRYAHEHGCPWVYSRLYTFMRGAIRCAVYWPKFREAVRVRPYALRWQERVQMRVCAPGGAGRKRDRAAFEADFGL